MERAKVSGVVLAGGYSRRFGERDNALARVGGETLLSRVVARLGRVAAEVIVNCRADQRERFEAALAETPVSVRFAEDPETDRGPLFGFGAALRAVETRTCALVTCDVPFLVPRLLSALRGRLDADPEIDAAAVRTDDGRVQPTQAVYRTSAAESACRDMLNSDERRLAALLERLDCLAVSPDEVAGNVSRSLFDVDTPKDREKAVEMLERDESDEMLERDESDEMLERNESDERVRRTEWSVIPP
jgi:molybdopterin-guanine dinucleotide biosynthesis protein A